MREIEFRAWDGRTMYSPVLHEGLHYRTPRNFIDGIETDNPLMQSTGLADKNGVPIFEGDIVKAYTAVDSYQNFEDETYEPPGIYDIRFSRGAFVFGIGRGLVEQWDDGVQEWYSIENVEVSQIEVIGNIYESPDLLDQEAL